MKEIQLNRVRKHEPNYMKYKALVDDEDFERVNKYNWSVLPHGNRFYAHGCLNGKVIYLHTFITGFKETDHINHDGLDNRKCNLRNVTHQQNIMNSVPHKNTSSKYKGVTWSKGCKKWISQIAFNKKIIVLGFFDLEEMAAITYNIKAMELFGQYAYLNEL